LQTLLNQFAESKKWDDASIAASGRRLLHVRSTILVYGVKKTVV
jgi:hypothetical protein